MKHIKKFNENTSNSKDKFISKDDIYEINDMLLDLKDEGLFYNLEYYVDNSDVITKDSGDWVDEKKTNINIDNIRSISISFIASKQNQKRDDYWDILSNTLNRIVLYSNSIYKINIHHTEGLSQKRLPILGYNTDLHRSLKLAKNSSNGLIDICIYL